MDPFECCAPGTEPNSALGELERLTRRSSHVNGSSTQPRGTPSAAALSREEVDATLDALAQEFMKPELPYEWCVHPDICMGRSCCPRNPNCGD